jgi:ankyrin repeat protein
MQVLLETSECKELLDMYNNSGKHCLSIATDLGDIESVQLLLSKGARQWSSPVDGQIPLHIAASQGHVEIVRMLLRAIVSRAKLDKIVNFSYATN